MKLKPLVSEFKAPSFSMGCQLGETKTKQIGTKTKERITTTGKKRRPEGKRKGFDIFVGKYAGFCPFRCGTIGAYGKGKGEGKHAYTRRRCKTRCVTMVTS